MPSGFMDRYKGKIYQPTGSLQQIGSGSATSPGGGQINSTSAASTSGGIPSSSVANTLSTLGSFVVPAKTLDRFGRNILINAWGTFSTANAGLKTASIVFGSVTAMQISASTAAALTTPGAWFLSASVTCNSTDALAAKQTIWGQGAASTVHAGCSISTGAENMLLNSTVKVTGISSASTVAGDVILLGLQVEGLN